PGSIGKSEAESCTIKKNVYRRKQVMVDFAKDLQGKVAVVTGGGGVLCGAMAKELGKYGVKVVILNRTPEKGRKVADDIVAGGGTAEALARDVLDGDSIRQAAEYVQEKYGVC